MLSYFAKPVSVALLVGGMALSGAAPASAQYYHHYHHGYNNGYGYRHYHPYGYRPYGYRRYYVERPYVGVPCVPLLGVVSGNYCNY